MLHRRLLTCTGIAICTIGLTSALAGCLQGGSSGDPAAGFGHPPSQGGGSYVGETSPGGGRSDAGAVDAGAKSDAGTGACVSGVRGTFALSWTLEDASGAAATCDGVGGETVDIQLVSAASGAATSATFPCAALAATTCTLPGGSYALTMKLRNAQGAALSEVFAPTLILVEGQRTPVDSLPLAVGGDATKVRGFAFTWSIDKVGTQAPQSCAQAGAATVRLKAGTTTFDMTCADGKGRTTSLAPGSYPVTLDLLDASGAVLSETQTMTLSVAAGQLVFLGNVPFDVN